MVGWTDKETKFFFFANKNVIWAMIRRIIKDNLKTTHQMDILVFLVPFLQGSAMASPRVPGPHLKVLKNSESTAQNFQKGSEPLDYVKTLLP